MLFNNQKNITKRKANKMQVLELMNREDNWEEILQGEPYFINIKNIFITFDNQV